MQTVIGAYGSREDAELAVRSLERQSFSIQNLSIVDEKQRIWRRLHAKFDDQKFADSAARGYLVVAIAETPEKIEQARRLLPRPR